MANNNNSNGSNTPNTYTKINSSNIRNHIIDKWDKKQTVLPLDILDGQTEVIINTPDGIEKATLTSINATDNEEKRIRLDIKKDTTEEIDTKIKGNAPKAKKETLATAYALSKGFSSAKKIISTVSNIPGAVQADQASQNTINNILSVSNSLISDVGSIASAGATMKLFGAVVAAITVTLNESLSIMKNLVQWDIHQTENNISETRNSERLGLILNENRMKV